MSTKVLLPVFLAVLAGINCVSRSYGQTLPGSYTTTWAGNSLSGKTDWIQGYMLSAAVNRQGKVFTMATGTKPAKQVAFTRTEKLLDELITADLPSP